MQSLQARYIKQTIISLFIIPALIDNTIKQNDYIILNNHIRRKINTVFNNLGAGIYLTHKYRQNAQTMKIIVL